MPTWGKMILLDIQTCITDEKSDILFMLTGAVSVEIYLTAAIKRNEMFIVVRDISNI